MYDKPPKRIYLQQYFDYSDDMVTWCEDKINEDDIEYILQSEYDKLERENRILLAKVNGLYLLFSDSPENTEIADSHLKLVDIIYGDKTGED